MTKRQGPYIPKPCLEQGCSNVARAGDPRCVEHYRERERAKNQRKTHLRTNQWKEFSKAVRATGAVCAVCGTHLDLTVDHIKAGSLEAGVQVLCRRHNASKGDR